MNISHLDHVALVCEDATVSKDWYIKIFGMEWIHRKLWENNPIFLRKGACFLALFQAGSQNESMPRRGTRIDHFAFKAESREDYEAMKTELRQKGIKFDEKDHQISHSIYLQDPDGITVEITTYDV